MSDPTGSGGDPRQPRALVTGAAGFIGSHLARHLVRNGWGVSAVVRPGSSLARLAGVLPHLQILEGDLWAPGALAAPLREAAPDVCFHLAWSVPPASYLEAAENLECVAGSLRLLGALEAAGCGRLVFAGTCIEYAAGADDLGEDSPLGPQSLYAASKLALWSVAEAFARSRGLRCAWARIFVPYGPWEPEQRLVPSVIGALLAGRPCPLTDGTQVREFIHVEDVASALWAVAARQLEGPVNIAAARPASVRCVAETIGRLTGRPELLRFGKLPERKDAPARITARPGRLREETPWSPRYDLEQGLGQTIAWWREPPRG